MIRRFFATWVFPVSAGLVALSGCNRQDKDTFGGVVDSASFDANHSANTDVDNDGVAETLLPKEGYAGGKVVQFFDFGQIPAFFSEGTDAFGQPFSAFLTQPNFMFRMTGECEPGLAAAGNTEPFDFDVDGDGDVDFTYDPRFDAFSPFRHHDIFEFLPDGADVDEDGAQDYNPIVQIIDVAVPAGADCNEILNGDTLRKRVASEDFNGNGILDKGEDLDQDGRIDADLKGDLVIEQAEFDTPEFKLIELFDSFTRLPDLVLSAVPDPGNDKSRNFGFLRFDADGDSEDLDIDQRFEPETEVDVDDDNVLDDEDRDQDGNFDDQDEDTNGNDQLDAGEDIDGDNRLDSNEDLNGNGEFDVEDKDHDGRRDCGEVIATRCTEANFNRAPVTEDINGDGILDPGEDGSQAAVFGGPNGVLDTEDIDGDGVLDTNEDLNGNGTAEGLQGGIPAYDDNLIGFFKTFLLHFLEFRPPTIGEVVLATEDVNNNGVLDAGEDANGNGVIDELSSITVGTMQIFFDDEDSAIRPIFEFAPGEAGFEPIAEVITYTRLNPNLVPGEITSALDLFAAVVAGDVVINESTEVAIHVGFARSGAAIADPAAAGDSIFFRDTDNDGIPDFTEEFLSEYGPEGEDHSDGNDVDTDGDGINDGREDKNRDGKLEDFESDPFSDDVDADGLTDPEEVTAGTNPINADTDGDGLSDSVEVNGVTNPLNPDSDADDLNDGAEVQLGTDPNDADTDNDGLSDGDEVLVGTDPLDPSDP